MKVSTLAGLRKMDGRWIMLILLFVGMIEATVNWFSVVDAIPYLEKIYRIDIVSIGFLVSAFVISFSAFMLPSGILSNRFGPRKTMTAGFIMEGLGSIISGFSPNFPTLLISRAISGFGGSIVIIVTMGVINIWFRGKEISMANGIASTAAFALGAALVIGLGFPIIGAVGLSDYFILTGVSELVVCFFVIYLFRLPQGNARLRGGKITLSDVKEVIKNRMLFLIGLSVLGAYGENYVTATILPTFARQTLGFSYVLSTVTSLVIFIAGIPAAPLGGRIADKSRSVKKVFTFSMIMAGLSLLLILPYPIVTIWIVSLLTGFFFRSGFATFVSTPAILPGISEHNIPLASGFIMTLASSGAFIMPIIFGYIVSIFGYRDAWITVSITCVSLASIFFLLPEPYKIASSREKEAVETG